MASTNLYYVAIVKLQNSNNRFIFSYMGTLPDGRTSYYADPIALSGGQANSNPDFNNVMELSNSGRGNTKRTTVSLEKSTEHFFIKGSSNKQTTNF